MNNSNQQSCLTRKETWTNPSHPSINHIYPTTKILRASVQLGELLVKAGVVTTEQLETALGRQVIDDSKNQLGFYLKEMAVCTEQDLEWVVSIQHQLLNGGVDVDEFVQGVHKGVEINQRHLADIIKLTKTA